ncbi:hypothetical protein JW916_12010 [Candidatus Sumerlaeota bacterium]|nr:hypothetical protein [Candidatus Sumerlaeota bacterium]
MKRATGRRIGEIARFLRHLCPAAVLFLLAAAPSLLGAQPTRPEEDPEYAKIPAEHLYQTDCSRIQAILCVQNSPLIACGYKGWCGSGNPPDTKLKTIEFPIKEDILAATCINEGTRLFLAGRDGMVREFRRGKMEVQKTFPDDAMWADRALNAVAVDSAGKHLAMGGEGAVVRIFSLETGEELVPFEGAAGAITCLAFTPDGTRLACADAGGQIAVFDPAASADARKKKLSEKPLVGLALDTSGTLAYTAGEDGTLRSIQLDNLEEQNSVRPFDEPLRFLAYAPGGIDGALLMVCSQDGRVGALAADTLKLLGEIPGKEAGATAMATDPGGFFVFLGQSNGSVRQVFAYKVLRGDVDPTAWTKDVKPRTDREAFEGPGGRIGYVLQPVRGEHPGLQVVGWPMGFRRPFDRAFVMGTILTEQGNGDEVTWRPLKNLEDLDLDRPRIYLRGFNSDGYECVGEIDPLTRAQADALADEVVSLTTNRPLYELGLRILPTGYVYRLVPDGPAAKAGVVQGQRVVAVDDSRADLALECARYRLQPTPVKLTIESGGGTSPLSVIPREIPPCVRLARRSRLSALAGDLEKAEEILDETDWDKDTARVVFAFPDVLDLFTDPEYARDLTKLVKDSDWPEPLVACLARHYLRVFDLGAALNLLLGHTDPQEPDDELQLLTGLGYLEVGEGEKARPLLEAAAQRGHPEAYLPLGDVYFFHVDNKPEAGRAYKKHFYGPDPSAKIFGPDGKPLPPIVPLDLHEDRYEKLLELAREHGID